MANLLNDKNILRCLDYFNKYYFHLEHKSLNYTLNDILYNITIEKSEFGNELLILLSCIDDESDLSDVIIYYRKSIMRNDDGTYDYNALFFKDNGRLSNEIIHGMITELFYKNKEIIQNIIYRNTEKS